ncbi:MAG: hypothetical protein AAF604_21205 [Acidobacteriota bacterium]
MRSENCWVTGSVLALALLLGVPATGAEDQVCFADCSGDLAGERDRGPRLGSVAPAIEVFRSPDAGDAATLESLLRGRPVILAFGSLT